MARQFNGTSDFAVTAANFPLSGTNVVTLSVWLWWDTNADDDDTVLAFSANGSTFSVRWNPNHSGTGGKANLQIRGDVGLSGKVWTRPSAGAWHHYAIVIDKGLSTAEVSVVEVDGSAAAGLASDGSDSNNTNNFTDALLYLMSAFGGGALWGAGRLAGFGVWNRALTAPERATLAAGARPSSISSGLLESWNMAAAGSTETGVNGRVLNYTGTTVVADPPSLAALTLPHVATISRFTGFF